MMGLIPGAPRLQGFCSRFSAGVSRFPGFALLAALSKLTLVAGLFCLPISGCLSRFNDRRSEVVINYTPPEIQPITVSGQDFLADHPFPKKSLGIRAGGSNISPAISWAPVREAKSYAIVISDAAETPMIYWILVNIPNNIFSVPAGASPRHIPKGSLEIPNSFNAYGRYSGPVPASITKRLQKDREKHHRRGSFITHSSDKNTGKDFDEEGRDTIRVNVYASNMEKIPTLTIESMLSALQNTLIARGKISVDITD